MTKETTTTVTTLDDGFMAMINAYEREGMQRKAIMELVAPELKEIDKGRKEIKDALKKQIKAMSAPDACAACNTLCPTVMNSDAAARKRLQRRRTMLKGIIASQHGEWDITKQDGRLFAAYIGDAATREAITLVAALDKLVELDIIDYDATATISGVADALRDGLQDAVTQDALDTRSYGISADRAAAIADRFTAMQERANA